MVYDITTIHLSSTELDISNITAQTMMGGSNREGSNTNPFSLFSL